MTSRSASNLNLKGICAIPASPFDERGDMDWAYLRREVEFSIACGAVALLGPVMASEVWQLSVEERRRFLATVVEQAEGRLPVIAGVSANTVKESISLARSAAAEGADCISAMLPTIEMNADPEAAYAFFSALADAAELPIIIQTGGRGPEDRIPVPDLMRLVREIEPVCYVKDEGVPSNHRVTELLQAGEPTLKGVFGGMGGRYMIDEMRRGACGFAPICSVTDILVEIWNAFHAGDESRAMDIHDKLSPILNIVFQVGMSVEKWILVRRGLSRTLHARGPVPPLDEFDDRELSRRWKRIEPYLRAVPEDVLRRRPGDRIPEIREAGEK